MEGSLVRLRDAVVLVSRQEHVLGEIDLYAMPLPDRDGRGNLDELVKDGRGRLRHAGRCTVGKGLWAGTVETRSALADLRGPGDHSERNRGSEDLQIVIVDLVFQTLLTNLVEAVELVEVNAVPVRHQQSMEGNGNPALLADPGAADLAGLAQHDRSLGDEDVLVVVRVDGVRYQHLHWSYGVAVKPVH